MKVDIEYEDESVWERIGAGAEEISDLNGRGPEGVSDAVPDPSSGHGGGFQGLEFNDVSSGREQGSPWSRGPDGDSMGPLVMHQFIEVRHSAFSWQIPSQRRNPAFAFAIFFLDPRPAACL